MSDDGLIECPRPGCEKRLLKRALGSHAKAKHIRGRRCEEPDCTTPANSMTKRGKVVCEGHAAYYR